MAEYIAIRKKVDAKAKRLTRKELNKPEGEWWYGSCHTFWKHKIEYKNRDHRVTIICLVHGEFQVYAREHLDGKGCPECGMQPQREAEMNNELLPILTAKLK